MAIRPYLSKKECDLIISLLITAGLESTLDGMLLARKLGSGESKDKMDQQTMRHAAKKEELLGFSSLSSLSSFSPSPSPSPSAQTQVQTRPLSILTALASTPGFTPWESFSEEELAIWEESINPLNDI